MTRPSVALVGVSGYGRRHLLDLLRLHAGDRIDLMGIADPRIPGEVEEELRRAGASPHTAAGLDELLTRCVPDTVVIATPPHTHHALALTALDAGSSVYVEKPPVPLPAQLDDLHSRAGTHRVEFGFQQTRSVAMAVDAAVRAHPIGKLTRITGYGALQRPDAYYSRAPWAGRRMLGDVAVFDGSLFNPLAHTVHAALTLARMAEPTWEMSELEIELGAVRNIEADDTAAIRVRSARGPVVTAIGTTAADEVIEPSLLLQGDSGELRVRLRDLRIRIETPHSLTETVVPPAPASLEQAVLGPDDAADPFTDIDAVRPFVRLVAGAINAACAPERLTGIVVGREAGPSTVLFGVSAAIMRAVDRGSLLGETGFSIGAVHRLSALENWDGRMNDRCGRQRPSSEVA